MPVKTSTPDDRLKIEQCNEAEKQIEAPWLLSNGIGIGALFTALVGVASFFFTQLWGQRQTQDARIGQALERLADPSSPATRASAAATLQIFARPRWYSNAIDFITRTSKASNTRIIIEQLATSLRTESDPSVIKAIELALGSISERQPFLVYRAVTTVWNQIEPADVTEDIVRALSDRFGTRAEDWLASDPLEWPSRDKQIEKMLDEIAETTGIPIDDIRQEIARNQYVCAAIVHLRNTSDHLQDQDIALRLRTHRLRVAAFYNVATKIEERVMLAGRRGVDPRLPKLINQRQRGFPGQC